MEESLVLYMELATACGIEATVYRIGARCGKKDIIRCTPPRSCKFRVW